MARYYTIKETAEMLATTEAEVLALINSHLIPGNLIRADDGVLVGKDGIKRLRSLVNSGNKHKRTTALRQVHSRETESPKRTTGQHLATDSGLDFGQEPENPDKSCSAIGQDDAEAEANWHEYSWPLSEWVRLTGKKPPSKDGLE